MNDYAQGTIAEGIGCCFAAVGAAVAFAIVLWAAAGFPGLQP